MAALEDVDEVPTDGAQPDSPDGLITQWLCSQARPQRSLRWTLASRARNELFAELMLMLRLALGHQSPFSPLARGATTVKESVTDGLYLLTRLLTEFGDASMAMAFVGQVAGYVAEPFVASRLVPRLSFVGLRPSLQGIASLRGIIGQVALPRLSFAGLQPSLQGITPLRLEASAMYYNTGGIAMMHPIMPQLCFIGLRPSLHGCSGLGAPPAEEVAATIMFRQHRRGARQAASSSIQIEPCPPDATQNLTSRGVVPQLCFAGLPPSLQGCSGLGPLIHSPMVVTRSPHTASQNLTTHGVVPQLCLAGLPPSLQGFVSLVIPSEQDSIFSSPQSRQFHRHVDGPHSPHEQSIGGSALILNHGVVPPLYLAGLRPSLQGCSALGAPPSEEVFLNYVEVAVNSVPSAKQGPVPRLYLGGLRPSLQGCSGLGAPPSEEVAAHYHAAKSGMYAAVPQISDQTTLPSCPARPSTCHRKSPCRRRSWCRPVPQLRLAGLRVSLQGWQPRWPGLGAPPPEAV